MDRAARHLPRRAGLAIELTPAGLLPLALVLVWLTIRGLGALAVQPRGLDSVLAGATLTVGILAVGVRLLGAVGLLKPATLLGLLVLVACTATITVRARGTPTSLPWRQTVSLQTAPMLVVVVAALVLAAAAAHYLPIWQYDALGYHLPYVDFALQRGTLADVPADVPYLSTYPHVVEQVFIGWRAMLPDDRLVDLAQVPFGLLGMVAIATIASHRGARPDYAVAAGAAWLTLPAVLLQLPTNYVDVASAALLLTSIAFILGPMDARRILLAGLAIGLFLGSKPTAPIGVVLLLVALAVRAHHAGLLKLTAPSALVAVLVGGESYVVNLVRHGNPTWPVRIDLGPLHLPGTVTVSDLLSAGAAAPRTHGNLVERVWKSWTVLDPPLPVFDMRIGGLGLLFLIAVAVAIVVWVRAPTLPLALVAAATLATPDPAVARFVLGFAGLVTAIAVTVLKGRRIGFVAFGAAALIGASSIVVAYPGLTGEGPPLTAYPHMSQAERQRAVGADGSPAPFLDAIAQVGPGQRAAFDKSADLPYLAWPFDLSRQALRIPDDVTAEQAQRILDDPSVRMLIVGDETVTAAALRLRPDLFIQQFHCKFASCAIYLRS